MPFYKKWLNNISEMNANISSKLNSEYIVDKLFGDFYIFRINSNFNMNVEYEIDAIDNGLSYSKLQKEIEN